LDSCRALESEGFEVTYLPVLPNGLIDMELLKATIRPDTALVSIMGVNNEIGVIQPMKEIGQLCRERKVFFHSDLAQMAGKVGCFVVCAAGPFFYIPTRPPDPDPTPPHHTTPHQTHTHQCRCP
jgi:hypothetical protein